MKFFAFILSVYFLALTITPCIDVPKDDSLQKVELSKRVPVNSQNEADHCSPFCACSCCATPVISQVYVIHFDSFLHAQKYFPNYSSGYIASLYVSIWQPPKIG
jgi:hypothetical protein